MPDNSVHRGWPTPERLMQFSRVSQIPGQDLEGPLLYTFRLNPNKLKVNRKKIERYTLTKAGYERTDWGNDIVVFTYSGSSGALRVDEPIPGYVVPSAVEDFDIRKSQAWAKFMDFDTFFRSSEEEEIHMSCWVYPYNFIGSIGELDFDLDAERPNSIMYNFKFTAFPDKDRPILNVTDRNLATANGR